MARMNLPGLSISQKSLTQPCLQGFSTPASLGQEFWCPQTQREQGVLTLMLLSRGFAEMWDAALGSLSAALSSLCWMLCGERRENWAASSCKNRCHVSGGASRQRQGEMGRTAILALPSQHPPTPLLLPRLCTCMLDLVPNSHFHT